MIGKRLKTAISLWSADLANLEKDIFRVDPYTDSYHIDISDGTYAPSLLFFPDLVKAIRPKTKKLMEVHLITCKPERWVEPFKEAGADRIIFFPDTVDDVSQMIRLIQDTEMSAGLSLAVSHPIQMIESYLGSLDLVCVMGTDIGIKGVVDLDPDTCQKITELCQMREKQKLDFDIEADGAIRTHTVPELREAGTDIIVPGSLVFSNDLRSTYEWLGSL